MVAIVIAAIVVVSVFGFISSGILWRRANTQQDRPWYLPWDKSE